MSTAPLSPTAPKPWYRRRTVRQIVEQLDPLTRERFLLRHRLGYWPRILRPRSFNERLAHLRFFEDTSALSALTDKFAVREYVRDRVGQHVLNTLLAVGNSFDAIDWNAMPDSFVVKATHGSAWNHFVHRKTSEELATLRTKCTDWLSRTHGVESHQRWYQSIPPRIVVEPILTDQREAPPPDFKCYTFRGRVHFVQVSRDRFNGVACRFYDRGWTPQNWGHQHPVSPRLIPAPPILDQVFHVAESLAKPFPFVRVDLYCPDDRRVVFGEMTFCPSAGRDRFVPDSRADFDLGELW